MVRRNVPLVEQVILELLADIDRGEYVRSNGMLPSESELAQHFSVSRATVRDALSQLEATGVVIRRQGVGTFVNPFLSKHPAALQDWFEEAHGFVDALRDHGAQPGSPDPARGDRAGRDAMAQPPATGNRGCGHRGRESHYFRRRPAHSQRQRHPAGLAARRPASRRPRTGRRLRFHIPFSGRILSLPRPSPAERNPGGDYRDEAGRPARVPGQASRACRSKKWRTAPILRRCSTA